ncbi:MAG: TIGR02270 family protein [Polyangiaceae bacterium]|nr:TIGR02270 family protein [Polyangiaceae bacterium]
MIRAVVEQHAEDAAFLFTSRNAALEARYTRLEDLERLDERIAANLDGLRFAKHAGQRIARMALRGGDAGEVFAAAVLACESEKSGAVTRLFDEAPADALAEGLCGAVAWLPFGRQRAALRELRASSNTVARRAALVAQVAHRRDPENALLAGVLDDDPRIVATALRAIGELGRTDLVVILAAAMHGDDPEARFWAAWSAALLGEAIGSHVLRAIAEHGRARAEQAAEIAAMTLPPSEAVAFVEGLTRRADRRRAAIRGAAALGDPKLLPTLLEWLDQPALARPAADAITTITGLAITAELSVEPPSDDDDDDETIDPDDGLAWPDAPALRAACERSRASWPAGTRHVLGHRIERSSLVRALRLGRQPERVRAAFELARAGEPLIDVEAPSERQLRALAGRS